MKYFSMECLSREYLCMQYHSMVHLSTEYLSMGYISMQYPIALLSAVLMKKKPEITAQK